MVVFKFSLKTSWYCELSRCVFVGLTFMAALPSSSQRCEEVASLQSQVSQEKELRGVMEGCLMEEKMAWRRVNTELVENHRLAQDMSTTLAEIRACLSELLSRLSAEDKSITGIQGGHTGVKGGRWCLLHITFYCCQNQRTLLLLLTVKQGLSCFSTVELKKKLDSSEEDLGELV